MDSFEELGLGSALVEALSAEGFERPTPLQAAAIPVVRRANNLVLHAGPGAGTLFSYGVGILDRIAPDGSTPRALVVQPTADDARRCALSLSLLAETTGQSVSALGSPWARAARADVVFGTARELVDEINGGALDPAAVDVLVVDGAAALAVEGALEQVETLLQFLPHGQRVILGLPMTEAVASFAARHVKRAIHLPPQAAAGAPPLAPERRQLQFRVVQDEKDVEAARVVAESLAAGAPHVALFFASESAAAATGDRLALHGWTPQAPGTRESPLWLGVDEKDAMESVRGVNGLVVVSFDVPAGTESLDRRHGEGRGGTVLVWPRELSHLRDLARRTGYRLTPTAGPERQELSGDIGATLSSLSTALESEDLPTYAKLLEPLLREHDATEIAAAAVALLRRKVAPRAPAPSHTTTPTQPPPAWARLFVSVGEKDHLRPGDLLGAITGETGIDGSEVGKIEVRDTYTLVDVHERVAERVIHALNGRTIRGRSARVDYDRGPARSRTRFERGK